jgi:hypothetical protein
MSEKKDLPDNSPVKIDSLEMENVKRVRAVELTPTKDGLTVIGGRNRQGKTSVLDAIAWALGGDRFRPDKPNRDGAATPAKLHVELTNGLVIERSGNKGSLKVTDPTGRRAGQTLVNDFVSSLALDLPKFLSGTDKERAETLLQVIGVGDRLTDIDNRLSRAYEERHTLGQVLVRKQKVAEDMVHHDDAPEEPVSVAELVAEQQGILGRNGMNREKRMHAKELATKAELACQAVEHQREVAADIKRQLAEANARISELVAAAADAQSEARNAKRSASELTDESTAEVEASIASIEATNELVRENQAKAAAQAEADQLKSEYEALNEEVDGIRSERLELLKGADLPLSGLSVSEDGALTYEGSAWSDMSGADQLKVATAIVHRVQPSCGFVLVDKLEQMDPETLAEFGAWCQSEKLQVIGTRVATDDTCSVVIEDGRVTQKFEETAAPAPKTAAGETLKSAAKPTTYMNKQTFASATDYGEEF